MKCCNFDMLSRKDFDGKPIWWCASCGKKVPRKMVMQPIVPEVCDRLDCKIDSCYGWDLCRQAREECTDAEWKKCIAGLFKPLR